MVERIVQHKHCRACGNVAEQESEFCGKECSDSHDALMKKKKMQYVILFVIAFVMMLASIILLMTQ